MHELRKNISKFTYHTTLVMVYIP